MLCSRHHDSVKKSSDIKHSLSTDVSQRSTSQHVRTAPSQLSSKDQLDPILREESTSVGQFRYKSVSVYQSRCDQAQSRCDQTQSRNQATLNHSDPSISNNTPIFPSLHTPLLNSTSTTNNHVRINTRVTPEHIRTHKCSPIGEFQQWINDLYVSDGILASHDPGYLHSKDSYHSNRKDRTAQIDAAEKYARLQSDQVSNIMWSNDDHKSLTTCHGGTLGRTEDQLIV